MPDYTVLFTHLRHGQHRERVMAQSHDIATRFGWRCLSEFLKRRDTTERPNMDGWSHVQTFITPPEEADTC